MNNPKVRDNLIEQTKKMKNGLAKELGAKGGKAKLGSKHLTTLIREVGSNIDWSKTSLKDKDKMRQLYGTNAWEAITYVAFTKAMAGDPKAMEWLAKNGFSLNIDITSDGKRINFTPEELAKSILRDDNKDN